MRAVLVSTMLCLLLVVGCSPTNGLPMKFTAADFSQDTEKILPQHDFSFATLSGKKVYFDISFDKEGEFFIEDYNIVNLKKTQNEFKQSNALKDKIVSLFKESNVDMVSSPEKADTSVVVDVTKISSAFENFDCEWDNFGFNLDNWAKMNWGIVIEANVSINGGSPHLFRRIVVLNKDVKLKRTGTYLVVTAHTDTELTTKMHATYADGAALANCAIVQKQKFTAALFAFVSNDWAGNITIYDPHTGAKEKSLSFDSDQDWDDVWTGKITDEKKAKALDYYGTPRGYFTILAYDLMEFIFEEAAMAEDTVNG